MTDSPTPSQPLGDVLEALTETRRLVGKCAESGFTNEDDVRALYVNNWRITEALASLSQPPEEGGWRPIETAPRDHTMVLIGGRYPNGVGYVDQCFWQHDHWYGRKSNPPTHWQPLPAAPSPQVKS